MKILQYTRLGLVVALVLLAAGCEAPPVFERTPEPAHVDQSSLLPCPECNATGLMPCPSCLTKGGFVCTTCEGFGIVRCPKCDLVIVQSDPSPERDLYYKYKTVGDDGTAPEAFEIYDFAGSHLHGNDRRQHNFLSALLLHGKRCKTCNSRGYVVCPDCDRGIQTCSTCRGRKHGLCALCKGSGFVPSLTGQRIRSRGRLMRKRKR